MGRSDRFTSRFQLSGMAVTLGSKTVSDLCRGSVLASDRH